MVLASANASFSFSAICAVWYTAYLLTMVPKKVQHRPSLYEAFLDESPVETKSQTPNRDIFPLIRDWARERGIFDKGNSHTQYVKLMEESGELAQSLLKKDKEGIKDAIGDMIVVLTNLSELEGMYIEDCIQFAYNEIKDRKGKMSNGTFVKKL